MASKGRRPFRLVVAPRDGVRELKGGRNSATPLIFWGDVRHAGKVAHVVAMKVCEL